MSTFAIRSVGFCAHYSRQGDWACAFALALARRRGLRLNIFHFVVDPYDAGAREPRGLAAEERVALLIERERELRTYYDERLGDYLEAGFRLCEERTWTELHRCLAKREFQVLVLACPTRAAVFSGTPLDQFATSFVCPVVLVGPSAPRELRLNPPAALVADHLGLQPVEYDVLPASAVPSVQGNCAVPAGALE
jgi:hypothetical protein